MKRVVLAAMLMVCWLSGVSGQQPRIRVPSDKKIWFNSAPAAVDMAGMVGRYDEPRYAWTRVRPYIGVFQYYQGHTFAVPPRNVEGNTYNILSREGFFRRLRTHLEIAQAIEVTAVKEYSCDKSIEKFNAVINAAVDSVIDVRRAGGDVRYLTIDSSLVGGLECPVGALFPDQVGQLVAAFMREVRLRLDQRNALPVPFDIGDVEPYPALAVRHHRQYIERIQSDAARYGIPGLSHYHFDVDVGIVSNDLAFARDVREMASFLKGRGIRFGLIINGENSDSAVDYFRTANSRLVRYKNQRLEDYADNIIIQSWAESSNGRKHLPPNLPENDGHTHMNFVWHVLNCFFTPDWDCSRYPNP